METNKPITAEDAFRLSQTYVEPRVIDGVQYSVFKKQSIVGMLGWKAPLYGANPYLTSEAPWEAFFRDAPGLRGTLSRNEALDYVALNRSMLQALAAQATAYLKEQTPIAQPDVAILVKVLDKDPSGQDLAYPPYGRHYEWRTLEYPTIAKSAELKKIATAYGFDIGDQQAWLKLLGPLAHEQPPLAKGGWAVRFNFNRLRAAQQDLPPARTATSLASADASPATVSSSTPNPLTPAQAQWILRRGASDFVPADTEGRYVRMSEAILAQQFSNWDTLQYELRDNGTLRMDGRLKQTEDGGTQYYFRQETLEQIAGVQSQGSVVARKV